MTDASPLAVRTRDGLNLFAHEDLPQSAGSPVATVGIVHGLGEHTGRYDHVAAQLRTAGFRVVRYDHRGHGKSPGTRGHIDSYDELLDDLEAFVEQLCGGDLPVFLYGHSLGGGLVLNFALRRTPSLAGIIASSPLLLPTEPPPAWKVRLAQVLHRLLPRLSFATGIAPHSRSHDPAIDAAFERDTLNNRRVTARLGLEMLTAGEWALSHAQPVPMPVLLMHGTADPLTSATASEHFFSQMGPSATLKLWPNLLHELHWEVEREEVVAYVADWVKRTQQQAIE